MRFALRILAVAIACSTFVHGQTAEELVAKNTEAKGGLEKIKALKSVRMTGKMSQGAFTAQVGQDAKLPDMLRQAITISGMTQIQAYDGQSAWQISPFQGRRDPELLGEDDARDLIETADFYGPLIDYKEKGNTVEYLGRDTIDGDDVYRLKVTLKNGDVMYYYLDPDTYIEIRTEKQQFIRGSVRETMNDLGSYKPVNGVMYPFSLEIGPKNDPTQRLKVTFDKIDGNVALNDTEFKMPAAPAVASPQQHPEPPPPKKPKKP
jgi:outer membrane lipoprotein-sorting protein